MAPPRKNLILGLTATASLVLLAGMILRFGTFPAELFSSMRMPVQFRASRADGISTGSAIRYRGVVVGSVSDLTFSTDGDFVIIQARLDAAHLPPANVVAKIRTPLLGGTGSISMELPPDTEPKGAIQPDQVVVTEFVGIDVLPPAFAELAGELRTVAQDLNRSHLIENISDTVKDVRTQIDNAGRVVQGLQQLVNDPKVHDSLRAAMDNFRVASESADRITANLETFSQDLDKTGRDLAPVVRKVQDRIDQISRQVGDRLDQAAKLMETFQAIARKVDAGPGTAAKLINDGQLYDSLADTSRQLSQTIGDLHRLVDQWEQEGVYLRLTK